MVKPWRWRRGLNSCDFLGAGVRKGMWLGGKVNKREEEVQEEV